MTLRAQASVFVCLAIATLILAISSSGQPQQSNNATTNPEAELQTGIALTRNGDFTEAIPHFLAARGHVNEEYAEDFNLALCYVATGQDRPAIQILIAMRAEGHTNSEVDNLLAQAYIGDGQTQPAFEAFQQAATLTPQNEKLYLFIADACMQKKNNELGLRVMDLGVRNVPQSPRIHYQRALFLNNLERFDLAQNDFEATKQLAPESEFAFLADGQEGLLEGNIPQAVRAARAGVQHYPDNYILLQMLGEALIHAGAAPGQPDFQEALGALQKSVALRPDYAQSQTALGKLYLMENRVDDAIVHLEAARRLDPSETSVYSHLATAYRRKGEPQEAQKMLTILAGLNDAVAGKIRAGPPARAGSSGSPQ
ncbi:MAG TPA: tetratricopeptide repeat protein [Candidatus Acidoferrales bacterium]|nr:tetratricopeptide repeat protein [Candidatus Acidoferrales bacterium]